MRAIWSTLFVLTASTGVCQEYSYLEDYRRATFGVEALPTIGLKLGVLQVRNSPHEWTRDVDGFGKRTASVVGSHLIGNTVEFSVARIRHEEVSYRRSEKSGIWPRLEHALVSSVVTRDIDTGESTLALGRISGAYANGFFSRTWQPERDSAKRI